MTVDLVKELRAGLARLPKGPWRHSPWHIEEDFDAVRVAEGWILCTLSSAEYAKHIARCSGENIAALLDHIEALKAALTKAKAFHDRDSGCNGFTADYEILRLEIDEALGAFLSGGQP